MNNWPVYVRSGAQFVDVDEKNMNDGGISRMSVG